MVTLVFTDVNEQRTYKVELVHVLRSINSIRLRYQYELLDIVSTGACTTHTPSHSMVLQRHLRVTRRV